MEKELNIILMVNGDRYEGDFRNELREGKGIMYYYDGEKYEGDWRNGIKHGKGIYYFKEKVIGEIINKKEEE